MTVAPPQGDPWTAAEVLALPAAGDQRRYELVDGTLLVSPAPGYPHRRAGRRLAAVLVRAGHAADVDVEVFQTATVRVPAGLLVVDVAVVAADAARAAPRTLPVGALLAAVEIVSPATGRIDRTLRPALYAEAGIPSYWRLAVSPRPTLRAFRLHAGRYEDVPTTPTADGHLRVPEPFPVDIDPATLLPG
jgi:Uma2 family endonuclease